ncbi:hypothetical protein FOA52_009127 [Chlamydomonas sp. UWO 241]|nr:hypothetical protein FOA52_009127 [Chlamydomonas sp. UWO 241]
MICTSMIDNFYLTDEQLESSPSRADGVDADTESTLRHYGAELIQKAGILLGCPQAVMVTGQVLLQRFYCKKSLKEYNVQRLAAAATFLATKLEECNRRLRDIIMVFDRLFRRGDGRPMTVIEPGTKEYQAAKDTIIRYEREVLRTFGFIVHADHPHNYIINYVRLLLGDRDGARLMQLSWDVANDSLRTTLCVRVKAEVVACGAIFYAARKLGVPLPDDPNAPWWEVFSCTTDQLVGVVQTLHALYARPKAVYISIGKDAAPVPLNVDSPAPVTSIATGTAAGGGSAHSPTSTAPLMLPPAGGGGADDDYAAAQATAVRIMGAAGAGRPRSIYSSWSPILNLARAVIRAALFSPELNKAGGSLSLPAILRM